MQIMWNTCGKCSAHSEWLQYVSTERVQEKTRPLGLMQEVWSKSM